MCSLDVVVAFARRRDLPDILTAKPMPAKLTHARGQHS